MKTLVVYYSRTGHTRTVAHALAAALHANVAEITEPRSRRGIIGYLRSAREAVQQIPSMIAPSKDPSPYDLVLVGSPIWAAALSSPVRAYLMGNRDRLGDIAFFCTMGGHGSDTVFAQMQALAGKPPRASLAVTDRDIASGAFRSQIEAFAVTVAPPVPAQGA